MPLSLQSNLLRALQGNEIVRVGGLSPIQIDTRIICATNRSLQSMVADRQFRKDLFYRLDVLRITTPPLRKRADKAELIERILPRLAASSGLSLRKLPPSKMKMLLAHDWPGNVRELESALSRFLVDGSIDFATRDIKDELSENAGSQTAKLKNRLRSEKSQAIQEALVKAGFDKALAATMLGISRAQLYRELTRHDIFTGDTTSKRTQRIKKSG